jgi:hypothetical protein
MSGRGARHWILIAILVVAVGCTTLRAFASHLSVQSDHLTVFVVPPPPIPQELLDAGEGATGETRPAEIPTSCDPDDPSTSEECPDSEGASGP